MSDWKTKVYGFTDNENTLLCLVKAESKSVAQYKCFKNWSKEFGLGLIDFVKEVHCQRYKELDDIDFEYWDARNSSEEWEKATIEILRKELLLSYDTIKK